MVLHGIVCMIFFLFSQKKNKKKTEEKETLSNKPSTEARKGLFLHRFSVMFSKSNAGKTTFHARVHQKMFCTFSIRSFLNILIESVACRAVIYGRDPCTDFYVTNTICCCLENEIQQTICKC